jgi:thiol-disulfide isomerase/thioredoxin
MLRRAAVAFVVSALVLLVACGETKVAETAAKTAPPRTPSPGTTPQAAPALTGIDVLTGQPVDLVSLRGKPTVVVFWAHWCPHCQAEMPVVQDLYESFAGKVNFVGVATAIGQQPARPEYADPQAFIGTVGLTMPTILDTDGALLKAWDVSSFPELFLVDSQGQLVGSLRGEQGEERLRQRIEELE